jgi:hypothetical protein
MLLMAIKTVIVAIKKQTLTYISGVFNMRSNKPTQNEILFFLFSPNITESATFLLMIVVKFWVVCQRNKKRTNSRNQTENLIK